MEASELRIGNLIIWDGLEYYVKPSFFDQSNEKGEWNIHGIPLTEELLLKFGFVNFMGGYWELEDRITILQSPGKLNFLLSIGTEYTTGQPFESVHQLQNLYFALTGEELTIKT